MGRRALKPDAATRTQVEALAAYWIAVEAISCTGGSD